jgi:hypothetical protein
MKKTRILIAGGYGAVGEKIAKLLCLRPGVITVVGGRNQKKAALLANQINCDWIYIDLDNPESIASGLKEIDIVINCYIPSDNFPVQLAEIAVRQQVNYLDLSAFNGYCSRVMQLKALAMENGATLITALGAYPGIPGLVLADAREDFSEIISADFYFTMGVHYMMNVPPLVWNIDQWQKPQVAQTQEPISEPFNKKIFFSPGMITHDLHMIPETMKIEKITYWSGMENLLQGFVFYIGMKMGWARNERKATRFLKLLKFLGKGRKNHPEMALKAIIQGIKDGKLVKRIMEIHGTEDDLTAVIPVLVCDQLINGQINQRGAFTGPQIVNSKALMQSLQDTVPGYKETWASV